MQGSVMQGENDFHAGTRGLKRHIPICPCGVHVDPRSFTELVLELEPACFMNMLDIDARCAYNTNMHTLSRNT